MAEDGDTNLPPDAWFDDTTRFNVPFFSHQASNLDGEKQALSPIAERISDNPMTMQCDLTQIIHGTMAAALLKRGKTPEHPGGEEFSIDIAISGEVDRRKSVRDIWGSASTRNFSGKSSKGEAVIFDPKQSRGTVGRLQAVGESLGAGGGEAPGTGASTHRDAGKEDAESINRSDEGGKELATGDLTAGRCRTRHVGRRRSSLRHWLDGRGLCTIETHPGDHLRPRLIIGPLVMDELDGHGRYTPSGGGMPHDHQSDKLRDIVASIPNRSEILKATVERPVQLERYRIDRG
ncbi:hypothetical protein AUP68_05493 [Ilyonectria robusta]